MDQQRQQVPAFLFEAKDNYGEGEVIIDPCLAAGFIHRQSRVPVCIPYLYGRPSIITAGLKF
jgi:hypothetical protein